MAFPVSPSDGDIRTHADGRRWQYDGTLGVWDIKTETIDDADYTGPAGAAGPQGPIGTGGVAFGEFSVNTSTGMLTLDYNGALSPGDFSINNDGEMLVVV